MQIVSTGDNFHEMLNLFSVKNQKNISKCRLPKILPRVLSTKIMVHILLQGNNLISEALFINMKEKNLVFKSNYWLL